MKLGLAHRLESLNAFVARRYGDRGAVAHSVVFAICDNCGQVKEVSDIGFSQSVGVWAKASRFAVHSMTFELRGQSAACELPEGLQGGRGARVL